MSGRVKNSVATGILLGIYLLAFLNFRFDRQIQDLSNALPTGVWAIVMIAGVAIWVIFIRIDLRNWRRRRRRRLGLCLTCGYDLTGNQSGVCPECGTPAPASGAA